MSSQPPAATPSGPTASPRPRFAVTMTVRNNATTVGRALESLLPELGDDGELAIVDARSTDGTYDRIREAVGGRPNVRFESEECNRGGGRNRALGLTRAPIVVTHLDGDTRYVTGVVRSAALAMEALPDRPTLNVVGRDDPNPSSTRFFVWDRETLRRIGGYPEVQLAEDLGVVLRGMRAGVRFRRYLVRSVGSDLQARDARHGSSVSPWRRRHVALRAAKKFALLGYRYPEFVRYLAMTRRTTPRFLAGSALAAGGYVLFAATGRSDTFLDDGLGETSAQIRAVTSNPDWPRRF